jgi:hexosaminidase
VLFPRLCALAEVVWSAKEQKDYANFLERVQVHLECLRHLQVSYRSNI